MHSFFALKAQVSTAIVTVAMSLAMVVSVAKTPAQAAETPYAISLIKKLDLSSFPNSTRPRQNHKNTTPDQVGFNKATMQNGTAYLIENDGQWNLRLRVLSQSQGHIVVCFGDQAQNGGGTYDAEEVLKLTLNKSGLYEGEELPARPDCPAMPGQG